MIPAQADAQTVAPGQQPPTPPLRLRWALGGALLGGLALDAAFPPAGLWPLAAAGPALLVIALWGRSLRGSFCVGLIFGVAFFFPLLAWVINLAWYAWVALAAAEAVIFGVLAMAQRLLLKLPAWPFAVAGWWVAAEGTARPVAVRRFPVGQARDEPGRSAHQGWAAVGGAPLLTFLLALAGATLAWLVLTLLTTGAGRRRTVRARGAGVRGGRGPRGHLRRAPARPGAAPAARPPKSPPSKVAYRGPGPLAAQLNNDWTVTLNHVAATDKLARQVKSRQEPPPDLVIWPENSTDIDPTQYPPVYQQIASAAATIGHPILVGAVLQDPLRNAGLLWLPGKGPVAMYVKQKARPVR